MGYPPWTQWHRFADALSRYENHDEMDKLIEEWTSQRDKREVMGILQKAGVAAAPVLNYGEVLSDPQIVERGFFETVTRPVTGTHPYPGTPMKFAETPLSIRKAAPTLGEDNEYILTKLLKMSKQEIEQLAAEEIIGTKPQGWAFAMDADEAISRIKDIHTKAEDSSKSS
jgi:benzylsuccinate CoA-transferase BbsF subunit